MNCCYNNMNVAGASECADNSACGSVFGKVVCLIVVLIVFEFLTQIFNNNVTGLGGNSCGC